MLVDASLCRRVRDISRVTDTFSQRGLRIGMVALTIFWLSLPTEIAWAHQTAQASQSKPASSAASRMTNADVIQMVTAGLSEQIIIASIRQAPAKDFDLTPTGLIALKKAGVADTVILVMQEVSASVKPVSAGGDKMPSDEREPIVNAYLRQRVTSESAGAFSLASFRKTNGYEERLTGAYNLEWQADISVEQDIWKAGNGFVGYFESFHVMAREPGPLDSIGMSPKHFNKGTRIRLTGDSTFRKTEQGWRLEGLKIKGAQVVAESDPVDKPPVAGSGLGAGDRMTSDPRQAYSTKQYDRAISLAKTLLSANPKDSKALTVLAESYFMKDDFDSFAESAIQAINAGGSLEIPLRHHHSDAATMMHPVRITVTAQTISFDPQIPDYRGMGMVVNMKSCTYKPFTVNLQALGTAEVSIGGPYRTKHTYLQLIFVDSNNPKKTAKLNFYDRELDPQDINAIMVSRPHESGAMAAIAALLNRAKASMGRK